MLRKEESTQHGAGKMRKVSASAVNMLITCGRKGAVLHPALFVPFRCLQLPGAVCVLRVSDVPRKDRTLRLLFL